MHTSVPAAERRPGPVCKHCSFCFQNAFLFNRSHPVASSSWSCQAPSRRHVTAALTFARGAGCEFAAPRLRTPALLRNNEMHARAVASRRSRRNEDVARRYNFLPQSKFFGSAYLRLGLMLIEPRRTDNCATFKMLRPERTRKTRRYFLTIRSSSLVREKSCSPLSTPKLSQVTFEKPWKLSQKRTCSLLDLVSMVIGVKVADRKCCAIKRWKKAWIVLSTLAVLIAK